MTDMKRETVLTEENLKMLAGFRLLDDDFMTVVFDRNTEATELVLNIILGRNDMKVLEVIAQREYTRRGINMRNEMRMEFDAVSNNEGFARRRGEKL